MGKRENTTKGLYKLAEILGIIAGFTFILSSIFTTSLTPINYDKETVIKPCIL